MSKKFYWSEAGDVITGFGRKEPEKKKYVYDMTYYRKEYYKNHREKILAAANSRYKPKNVERKRKINKPPIK